MNLRQTWVRSAAARLAGAGVPDPLRDARLLLRWVLGIAPEALAEQLIAAGTSAEESAFKAAVDRRAGREPISYITGHRLFWGREFRVNRHVLDPRPESETLIAEALRLGPFTRVLDLGTGSGCLLITLLAEWREAEGLGVDLSADALEVAAVNAQSHALGGRARFLQSDWVDGVAGPFDLIIANPPYIPANEYADLAPEVREFEPSGALIAEDEGLADYRRIALTAHRVLTAHGLIMCEVGEGQSEAVSMILADAGWAVRSVVPDLDGRGRVVVAGR